MTAEPTLQQRLPVEVRCAHGVLCSRHLDRDGAESWIAGVVAHKRRRADCAPYVIEGAS